MAEDIKDMLAAVRAESESTTETPTTDASETQPPVTTEQVPTGQPSDGKQTVTDVDSDTPSDIKEYLKQHPEHRGIYDLLNKTVVSGLTPKLQQAAEDRRKLEELSKQFEGVDPQVIQTVRQLNELAESDPAKVAEYFRNQAEEFERLEAERRGPPDPLADYVPQTDEQALVMKELQALKEWKVQQEKLVQQTVLNQEANRINRELDAAEREYNTTITDEQRVAAWKVSRESGIPVADIWFIQNKANLLPNLIKKATDAASSVVQTKVTNAAGNPAPVASRGTEPEVAPQDFMDFLKQAREEIAASGSRF